MKDRAQEVKAANASAARQTRQRRKPRPFSTRWPSCRNPIVACQSGCTRSSWRPHLTWAKVFDQQVVLSDEAPGDQRAVAGLRVALDAEQGGGRVVRELGHQRAEVERIEDLAGVARGVLGCQGDAIALAHTLTVVLAVLDRVATRSSAPTPSHAGSRCPPRRARAATAPSSPTRIRGLEHRGAGGGRGAAPRRPGEVLEEFTGRVAVDADRHHCAHRKSPSPADCMWSSGRHRLASTVDVVTSLSIDPDSAGELEVSTRTGLLHGAIIGRHLAHCPNHQSPRRPDP